MSRIFDNIENKFDEGLHGILSNVGVRRADFCVGYFNLRGWGCVAEDVGKLPGCETAEEDEWGRPVAVHRICRLLVGMVRPPRDFIAAAYGAGKNANPPDRDAVMRWRRQAAREFAKQLATGVPTNEDERALKILRGQLIDGKVAVKLHLRHALHAKLYLAYRPEDRTNPIASIMGSSNLTMSGMQRNGELNAEFGDRDDNEKYAKWFAKRWNDKFSIDVTEDLIRILDESWASILGRDPYEVYLKIMYHLSREARAGVSEYHLPEPFDTALLEFQKTAVKMAVRHLETRGGAMIGDVVGLGKTITACAVAKYYEATLGASTLVISPPNLIPMWREYAREYDLKMDVRSVAEKVDPRKERFYRLAIIDESHNLRNANGQRYATIKDLLTYQGNKVLLLTATPYNKDFSDLASQLKLFVDESEDLGVRPEAQIREEGGEQQFAAKHPDVPATSIRAFEASHMADDWRDLMKLYLVRRTRTFIKKHYAKTDPQNGRKYLEMPGGARNYFPERKPVTVKFKTKPGDMFERLYCEQMVEWMGDLALPRYGLKKYIDKDAAETANAKDKQLLDNLSRAGKRLTGFCRSGLYKRMESSGIAFLQSLYRHAARNAMYLYALENGLELPINTSATDLDGGIEEEYEDGKLVQRIPSDEKAYREAGKAAYGQLRDAGGGRVSWISHRYFGADLAKDLKRDNETIAKMLEHCGEWRPNEDEKLNELAELAGKKHAGEKILVFTQYSDTAKYLCAQLRARGLGKVAEVDGETENTVEEVAKFSPVSNRRSDVRKEDETRILVATDMLSEGQNLQDGHIVVNYDLPWAIIRLIQRAGRVDRIGQKAEEVYCYSFFPQEGIDEIIRLRERLLRRINENAEAVGADEVFFEGNEQNLKDVFNEKAGILDEGEDGEVDLATEAYQIWHDATKKNPELADRIRSMPDVVFAAKATEGIGRSGTITYARTASGNDALVWMDEEKRVYTQSFTEIFNALKCEPGTERRTPLEVHHELVGESLRLVESNAQYANAGVMGSKSSARYRLFKLLRSRIEAGEMPLFETDLKSIADQIYNYPMREQARSAMAKMFAKKVSPDAIIEKAAEAYRANELCMVADEGDGEVRAAQIVCSMGVIKE